MKLYAFEELTPAEAGALWERVKGLMPVCYWCAAPAEHGRLYSDADELTITHFCAGCWRGSWRGSARPRQ